MHNIAHDIRYIPIFDISIQFKLCRYCITGLMYHDMAIYRYIIASLMYIHIVLYACICMYIYYCMYGWVGIYYDQIFGEQCKLKGATFIHRHLKLTVINL